MKESKLFQGLKTIIFQFWMILFTFLLQLHLSVACLLLLLPFVSTNSYKKKCIQNPGILHLHRAQLVKDRVVVFKGEMETHGSCLEGVVVEGEVCGQLRGANTSL